MRFVRLGRSGQLTIDVQADESCIVLELHGRIGPETSELLTSAVRSVLDYTSQRVVLDLHDVEMLSSTGVAALVGVVGTHPGADDRVCILGMQRPDRDRLRLHRADVLRLVGPEPARR